MKKYFIFTITCFTILVGTSSAHASLLGSTVFLSHEIRDISSTNVVDFFPVSVANGLSDQRFFGGIYTANPEEDELLIDFFRPFSFSNDLFNGHVVEIFNPNISSIFVDTNLAGWDNSRISLLGNSYQFNWANLMADQDTYFYAHFDFTNHDPGQGHAVPEPSSMALLAGAFSSLIFAKRRKKS